MPVIQGGGISYDEGAQAVDQAAQFAQSLQNYATLKQQGQRDALARFTALTNNIGQIAASLGVPADVMMRTQVGNNYINQIMNEYSRATGRKVTAEDAKRMATDLITVANDPDLMPQFTKAWLALQGDLPAAETTKTTKTTEITEIPPTPDATVSALGTGGSAGGSVTQPTTVATVSPEEAADRVSYANAVTGGAIQGDANRGTGAIAGATTPQAGAGYANLISSMVPPATTPASPEVPLDPAQRRAQMEKELEAQSAQDVPRALTHTVASGDTMAKIASQYGVSLDELIKANPQIANPNAIGVGQQITVPKAVTWKTKAVEKRLESKANIGDAVTDIIKNQSVAEEVAFAPSGEVFIEPAPTEVVKAVSTLRDVTNKETLSFKDQMEAKQAAALAGNWINSVWKKASSAERMAIAKSTMDELVTLSPEVLEVRYAGTNVAARRSETLSREATAQSAILRAYGEATGSEQLKDLGDMLDQAQQNLNRTWELVSDYAKANKGKDGQVMTIADALALNPQWKGLIDNQNSTIEQIMKEMNLKAKSQDFDVFMEKTVGWLGKLFGRKDAAGIKLPDGQTATDGATPPKSAGQTYAENLLE